VINGTHHISLSTADLERFLGFYRDLLGLPLLSKALVEPGMLPGFERIVGAPGARVWVAQLGAGNIRIEVFCYENPVPGAAVVNNPWDVGIRHIAFDVTGIDEEYRRLKGLGVEFLSEPQSLDGVGLRSVYMRDPDGNIVEMQEVFAGSPVDRSHVKAFASSSKSS
jgi:glyoxylase I family protein